MTTPPRRGTVREYLEAAFAQVDALDTMAVSVRDRSAEGAWGSGPTNPVVRTVTISAYCPVCGGPRGVPHNMNQHDDGAWYSTDVWTNPCGHTDRYPAVVAEAAALSAKTEG